MKLGTKLLWIAFLAVAGASTAWSQTTIYGIGGGTFRTNTWDYVDDFTVLGSTGWGLNAIDFDATGTTLWGVYPYGGSLLYLGTGTIDLTMGSFTDYGATGDYAGDITGLASAPGGTGWYKTVFENFILTGSYLAVSSNSTPYGFSGGGKICDGRIEAISVDANGNLYGFNNTDLSLYSIDTTTGAGTLIGPTGLAVTGVNGMDFDWSTNTLYVKFDMTGGGSVFAVIDPATGLATVLEDTTSIGGAKEFSCQTDGSPTPPGYGYCFGDPGSGTPCPCNNDNDGSVPGSGCGNGAFASGAQLTGSGVARITGDTLILATTGLEPSNSGLYFQANNDLTPGIVWGDGLQCAGGQLKRLGVRFSDANGYSDTSGYPTSISVRAGNISPGDTKYYQCWYRNPLNSPCGSDFNASNGYAIAWLP